MGNVVPFRRRTNSATSEEPGHTLELLVENWGQGDAELEEAIRQDCGELLERFSILPSLSLELPVVENLDDDDQVELADALCVQINEWAQEWHSRMLLEMLGTEILRLRELYGYETSPQ
ncbi:hypothetical protein CAI21_09820 [Alkalilimnicola ehrlichii]|uniref:Uncharacterized protein n=1 Tax=Alkalilimnicola ehrlichii TaxID=351052 RepID=A0A3E0WXI0_9GAMM|nr:hypothetical protein [Alkalilimnicola ehrlichii]RFA29357.1 hypothetical protein CAI21_09820 [Alkalilimnicola ehrlichii]RFA36871.1 hypothetical protein CAL65_10155 [Alkalilimnicola ehrlichii]